MQQVAEISESVSIENVPVFADRGPAPCQIDAGDRHHKEFRQRKGYPFAHRIVAGHKLRPDHVVADDRRVVEAVAIDTIKATIGKKIARA